jgi:glycerol kinase
MGAAYLAGITAGVWANTEEVGELWRPDRTFEPQVSDDERQERLGAWHAAIGRITASTPAG